MEARWINIKIQPIKIPYNPAKPPIIIKGNLINLLLRVKLYTGITKEVKLEVEIGGTIKDLEGNNRVGFSLEGEINRTDFDLKWNKALEFGGVAVSEKVELEVEVQAVEK